MKNLFILLILSLSLTLFSFESLGLDSGRETIELHQNDVGSNNVILIIGGIHGDETDTVDVINFLIDASDISIKCYYIPSISPTLSREKRRGYLREHLTTKGFVIPGSDLAAFNKSLYYRIFYGNNSTYNNGIEHYIDPNRDFIEQLLPSTRILIDLMHRLKQEYQEVVVLSFHGYMNDGKVYPEYHITGKDRVNVNDDTWNLVKAFEKGSSFEAQRFYSPAIPIVDRFSGELIAYTGTIDNITAMDIELNRFDRELNQIRSLNGVKQIAELLLQQK